MRLLCLWGWSSVALAATGPATPKALYEGLALAVVAVETSVATSGGGVVLHGDGFVVTAATVIDGGDGVRVRFRDGVSVSAKVVTLSRTEDLALLKVPTLPKGMRVPRLGSDAKVAQRVFSIGPPGVQQTLTWGAVTATREEVGLGSAAGRGVLYADLRGDPPGTPVFDERGDLVGLVSDRGSIVPAATIRWRLFARPIPYIGASFRRISTRLAELLNWPVPNALLVERVVPGSAAELAGLRGGFVPAVIGGEALMLGGDLIVQVAEFGPDEVDDIHQFLQQLKPGDSIPYTVVRAGKMVALDVQVSDIIAVPKLP